MDSIFTARNSCIRRIDLITSTTTSVNHYIFLQLGIINNCRLDLFRLKRIIFFDTKPLFSFVKNKLIQIQNTMFWSAILRILTTWSIKK